VAAHTASEEVARGPIRPKRRLEAQEVPGEGGALIRKQAKWGESEAGSGHVLDGVPECDWPAHVDMLRARKDKLKEAFRRTRSRDDARALLVAQDTYAHARRILASAATSTIARAEQKRMHGPKDTERQHGVWKAGVDAYFATWAGDATNNTSPPQTRTPAPEGEQQAGSSRGNSPADGGGTQADGNTESRAAGDGGENEAAEAGMSERHLAREAALLDLLHQAAPESEPWEPAGVGAGWEGGEEAADSADAPLASVRG
jgi:hypothetical protein